MDIQPKESSFILLSDWPTYLAIMTISIWGGFVSFFERKRKEEFSWLNFFAHLSSAGFAGMMASLACAYFGISGPLTGAMSGVAAYMGTPALIKLAMKLKVVRDLLEGDKP